MQKRVLEKGSKSGYRATSVPIGTRYQSHFFGTESARFFMKNFLVPGTVVTQIPGTQIPGTFSKKREHQITQIPGTFSKILSNNEKFISEQATFY